jgi:hypothetical protein
MADSTMAKKMNSASSTGKKFHCHHCDAFCSSDIVATNYLMRNVVMGRITTQTDVYFCSQSCFNYVIKEHDLQIISTIIDPFILLVQIVSDRVRDCSKAPHRDEVVLKRLLVELKAYTAMRNLFGGCKHSLPIQELILLQSKAMKMLGDLLEESHTNSEDMNRILAYITIVQELHLDVLGS